MSGWFIYVDELYLIIRDLLSRKNGISVIAENEIFFIAFAL